MCMYFSLLNSVSVFLRIWGRNEAVCVVEDYGSDRVCFYLKPCWCLLSFALVCIVFLGILFSYW